MFNNNKLSGFYPDLVCILWLQADAAVTLCEVKYFGTVKIMGDKGVVKNHSYLFFAVSKGFKKIFWVLIEG